MKNGLLILCAMFMLNATFAQEKKGKTETAVIQTSAEC